MVRLEERFIFDIVDLLVAILAFSFVIVLYTEFNGT